MIAGNCNLIVAWLNCLEVTSMAEQASSAFGNASSISTRLVMDYFYYWFNYIHSIICYRTININCDYRRGNIEGNTRSRTGSRKYSKKSINNPEEDTVFNSDNTNTL